jgi:hypothetical protein
MRAMERKIEREKEKVREGQKQANVANLPKNE